METTIFRQQTKEEQANFQELGTKTPYENFRNKVIQKEQEFTKKHKPYCARCAKIDWKDEYEKSIKEASRKKGQVTMPEIELAQYGDIARFKLLSTTEAIETIRVNDISKGILIGHHENYMCKTRNCGIAVFVPIEEKKK